MSGPSISTTLFKHYKQFGMKFTKDAIRMAGGRYSALKNLSNVLNILIVL